MSLSTRDTPRPFQPPITQRDLELEVAQCVGGVVSPVLANLFLHYAFDAWMAREFPGVTFERYVDDAVVHCGSERQAYMLRAAIGRRMEQVGVRLHPDKTKIVYCRDSNRRGDHPNISFTFLGYTFGPRQARDRQGLSVASEKSP
ncbi:hypothetical protein LWC34_17100 [Kibdelosporangium philippinense]|uniref:Reverse transcriptase domain-containing protein n=1 Tax=Kibdelosporangium philippinense TaxID=211113 RepID=A0ABS8Z9I8_9PSEU|nr:reverse transcriptase domain-containing protein [Kibdelosporangium philippinense]MCE7004534.1 hypothetical protein [Kibdelosporangium philippinense]